MRKNKAADYPSTGTGDRHITLAMTRPYAIISVLVTAQGLKTGMGGRG